MKKIKVVGEFEQLFPYIPDTPQLMGNFTAAIDALHSAVSDAWNNVKKEELKAICQDAESTLQTATIDTNFGATLASLKAILDRGGRFKRRSVLERSIDEVNTHIDEHGKGPENPITRPLFEPITEASLIDRSGYNEETDLLVVVTRSQNIQGLVDLARVLPYVNPRNTLIIQTDAEWVDESVEPYFTGMLQTFEDLLGKVVSVEDDDLPHKLIDLLESAQEE